MKSQLNLSHNHTFQNIQMVNAPAGGQAGAARCCHRAKCFGVAAGLCRGLIQGFGLSKKKAPPKAGLSKMFGLGGLVFAGLIGCDFFAGFLVDHF
ncbi:hypothetical protein, partial [Planktomarina temperata]|uniref:hypothetical protein n=1 Tax=Planktomarina temperata TaxID=1284658 RepID=UPI0035C82E6F